MTTQGENERLAVLESQYKTLQGDVTEIKADVKALVATQSTLAVALAVKDASALSEAKARSNNGVWVRSVLPVLMAGAALVLAIYDRIS
jgi:hypothetical protein